MSLGRRAYSKHMSRLYTVGFRCAVNYSDYIFATDSGYG